MCMSFYNNVNVLRYELTTEGLCLLERAKVFSVSPLLVQSVSLWDEVLPPPGVARHAGFRSRSVFAVIVFRCLVSFPRRRSGVVSPFEQVLGLPSGY